MIYYNNKDLFCSYNIDMPLNNFDISRNDNVFDVDIIGQLEQNFLNTAESTISSLFMALIFNVL